MALHEGEVAVDAATVRALLRAQHPDLADEEIALAGAGTDNTVYRVGDAHLVRLPRTRAHVASLAKELTWLPRLAPHLTRPVPTPVHAGRPDRTHPLPWAVYAWIDGEEPGPGTVPDWARYGRDLADFVASLHGAELQGAARTGDLDWYRGHGLGPRAAPVRAAFADARDHRGGAAADLGPDVDLDLLEEAWQRALALPDPSGPSGWLHADLRPSNLLVRGGSLAAVLDWGSLSVGSPDAEHALVWDLPAEGRRAYRERLDLDDSTWARARGWAIDVAVGGATFYRGRLPAFVAECVHRLRVLSAATD